MQNLFYQLLSVIDFFISPFLTALEWIGIDDMTIRVGFNNIEWFSISLYDLVSLVGIYFILFIFFRFIFRILRKFVKMITGGMNL